MKFLTWMLVGLCLQTCASSPFVDLKSVSMGDDKGLVLHKLGNPLRTYYKEDTQRWVYRVQDTSGPTEKEIWFHDGKVVFIDLAQRQKSAPKPAIDFTPVE